MIIIADSGSTKTEWAVMDGDETRVFVSGGINPVFAKSDDIRQTLRESLPVAGKDIADIFFYGAGCMAGTAEKMAGILSSVFINAGVTVENDLTGAARSLFRNSGGIACILGTGTATGVYDGESITDFIPSMGYILGDEGSGTALGKQLLAGIFKRQFSEKITGEFFREFRLSYPELIQKTYREPMPNRYIAGFTPFIARNINEPEIGEMVVECFDLFIKRNLLPYSEIREVPVAFTGSIAFHFREQLEKSLAKYLLKAAAITEKPLAGLIEYHTKE